MEMELSFDGPGTSLEGTEPCESCGCPVMLLDMIAAMRQLADAPAAPAGLGRGERWQEAHLHGERLTLREHTPQRCALVRAGTPEPLGDDWGGDEQGVTDA